jgi:hypothetical protein
LKTTGKNQVLKRKGVKTRGDWTLGKIKARCCIDGECWLWRLALNSGAPVMGLEPGKTVPVRRWLASRAGRELDRTVVVRTTCGNPTCVNPAHLMIVHRSQMVAETWTPLKRAQQAERSRAMAASGVGHCKIKYPDAVITSVRSDPCTNAEAVRKYGIPYSYVHKLRKGSHRTQRVAIPGSSVFAWAQAGAAA